MKCLLLDLEGVILTGKRKNYQSWLKSLKASPSKVHEMYHKLVGDLQRGMISCSKAVKIINDSLGTKIPVRGFFKQRTAYPFVNREVIDFVKKMKNKGVKVYLISDISKYSWGFIKRKYPFLNIFHQRILSFNTGFRKEQPEYYAYLERRLHCKKGEMLLIDDTLENISTAKKEGLRGIHFNKNTELKVAKINLTE